MPKIGTIMKTDGPANKFLRWAAELAGILSSLKTHDLRRGAAMENARISKETASIALGHGTDLIDDYIGKVAEATMNVRLLASTASAPWQRMTSWRILQHDHAGFVSPARRRPRLTRQSGVCLCPPEARRHGRCKHGGVEPTPRRRPAFPRQRVGQSSLLRILPISNISIC